MSHGHKNSVTVCNRFVLYTICEYVNKVVSMLYDVILFLSFKIVGFKPDKIKNNSLVT